MLAIRSPHFVPYQLAEPVPPSGFLTLYSEYSTRGTLATALHVWPDPQGWCLAMGHAHCTLSDRLDTWHTARQLVCLTIP